MSNKKDRVGFDPVTFRFLVLCSPYLLLGKVLDIAHQVENS